MSRNTKIIIGIIVGLVVVCICAGGIGAFFLLRTAGNVMEQATMTEPDQIAEVAQAIAKYDLPPGYSEQFGMSLFGFDVVGFGPSSGSGQAIMMMQFPSGIGMDQEQMEQQLQQSMQQQFGRQDFNLSVVDETTTTIRDQPVTLTVREGTDNDGNAMRQVSGVFSGQDGPVLLMIMGAPQNWDQGAIDSFIGSIR